MILLNHREIEYYSKKRWDEKNKSIDELSNIFSEWKDSTQKKAAAELMNWLSEKGNKLFDEDLIMDYGTDCLRLYLMFEKEPVENDKYYDSWEECNLEGAYKFIGKYRRLILTAADANQKGLYSDTDVTKLLSKVEQMKSEVCEHIAKGNTMPNRHNALSVMMEGFKDFQTQLHIGEYLVKEHDHEIEEAVPHSEMVDSKTNKVVSQSELNEDVTKLCKEIIIMMSPFAPYLSDDLLNEIEPGKCIFDYKYKLNHEITSGKTIKIPLQVNGKTKRILELEEPFTDEDVRELAVKEVTRYIKDESYKVIYLEKKLINFVTI